MKNQNILYQMIVLTLHLKYFSSYKNFLVKRLKEKNKVVQLIDEYGVDGDFVESQAFAYLAIRSYLKLPISFPKTTGVKKRCTGGVIYKN